jgi:short-subunit dehydrogenase
MTGWSNSCYQALRPHDIKVVLICPGFVDTDLIGVNPGLIRENMIKPSDIAEAAMLAVRCSPAAVPEQIVMRVCATPYRS